MSENHVVFAHQLTDREIWAYTLTLENLREDEYLELVEFHALNGTRTTWQYTASDGSTVAECVFQDQVLSWQREMQDLWSLQLRFQGGPLVSGSA